MSKPSLDMQLGALKHCVAYAGKQGLSDSIIKSAEVGIATMTFLRDHRDVFLTFYTILQAFPGSRVEQLETESYTDDYANGSGLGD